MIPRRLLMLICCSILLSNSIFASQGIPTQQRDNALYQRLPEDIRKSGILKGVHDGALPPYIIVPDQNTIEGVSVDLTKALGEILGVKIEPYVMSSFPGLLSGLKSGRFHLSLSPIADRPLRYASFDFIDFVLDRNAFAVAPGNPYKITGMERVCGKRIAVQSGILPEERLKKRSIECVQEHKKPIDLQSYPSLSTAFLAVRFDRADALVSSYIFLKSMVKITGVHLEVVPNSDPDPENFNYMGLVVPKGSPIKPLLYKAMQQLFANGTYQLIMEKWGTAEHRLPAPISNAYAEAASKRS